jgi:hypothetical protein
VAIGVEIRCGPLAGHPAPGEEVGFADDSPVEEEGFEPSVPPRRSLSLCRKGEAPERSNEQPRKALSLLGGPTVRTPLAPRKGVDISKGYAAAVSHSAASFDPRASEQRPEGVRYVLLQT